MTDAIPEPLEAETIAREAAAAAVAALPDPNAELLRQLAELSTRLQELGRDLGRALGLAETRLDAVEETLAPGGTVPAALAGLSERVSMIESRPAPAEPGVPVAVTRALDALGRQSETMARRISTVEDRI